MVSVWCVEGSRAVFGPLVPGIKVHAPGGCETQSPGCHLVGTYLELGNGIGKLSRILWSSHKIVIICIKVSRREIVRVRAMIGWQYSGRI